FLRRIIVYDDTEEHRELDRRIAQLQRDEYCVQRAALAAVLFTLAAMAGLAYVAILENNFPYNQSQLLVTVLCDVGLASFICVVGFSSLLVVYRNRLNRLREECRQLVMKLVERQLGKSRAASLRNAPSEPGDRKINLNPAKVDGFPEGPGSLRE